MYNTLYISKDKIETREQQKEQCLEFLYYIEDIFDYDYKIISDCIDELQKLQFKETSKNYRTCNECGKEMTEGYCIENGIEYYCSDECLHKNITEEEYLKLYDNGNGDSYWTEWECE